VLAIGALLLVAAGSGGSASASTAKRLFQPFVDGKVRLSVRVVHTRHRSCWTGSGAD
jgi:hypothetical protein